MPLLDHFHAPLFPTRPWESFHSAWANALMQWLNRLLPPRYFAAIQVHLGSQVEADVTEWQLPSAGEVAPNGAGGGLALATWAPPAAAVSIPAVFPDDIEVQVIDTREGAILAAVVELVSPRNKDRAEARRAFTCKCAAYLQRGLGLVVVDVVTNRQANLHSELMQLLGQSDDHLPSETLLYAAAYRPVRRNEENRIDAWPTALAVGSPLPQLPLCLRGDGCLPLDLESTYTEARLSSRL